VAGARRQDTAADHPGRRAWNRSVLIGSPRVALVCSWLNQWGGAERVLEVLHEMWPDAPVYTSVYLPEAMPDRYRSWDIRTSFMQRLPGLRSHFQKYLPLFPLAFEQFDFAGYDLVIDNSSAFSYGVITR